MPKSLSRSTSALALSVRFPIADNGPPPLVSGKSALTAAPTRSLPRSAWLTSSPRAERLSSRRVSADNRTVRLERPAGSSASGPFSTIVTLPKRSSERPRSSRSSGASARSLCVRLRVISYAPSADHRHRARLPLSAKPSRPLSVFAWRPRAASPLASGPNRLLLVTRSNRASSVAPTSSRIVLATVPPSRSWVRSGARERKGRGSMLAPPMVTGTATMSRWVSSRRPLRSAWALRLIRPLSCSSSRVTSISPSPRPPSVLVPASARATVERKRGRRTKFTTR